MELIRDTNEVRAASVFLDRLLASPTNMLNISRFELRLLTFFDQFCLPFFTTGLNEEINYTWKCEVPRLFLSSRLVRDAIYLFAAINMWLLCDVHSAVDADNSTDVAYLEATKDPFSGHTVLLKSQDLPGNQQSLFEATAGYFSNTLTGTQGVLATQDSEEISAAQRSFKHLEAVISGILIFSYLGIHPHRLIPLVTMDDSASLDFMTLSQSIRLSVLVASPWLKETGFRGLYTDKVFAKAGYRQFELTNKLRDRIQVDMYYYTLIGAIERMESCMHQLILTSSNIPLYKWAIGLPEKFYDLLRQKHCGAMNILFHYSCIAKITGFSLLDDHNMWGDYIGWYMKYFKTDDFDYKHYWLANVRKYHVTVQERGSFSEWDPETKYAQFQY